MMAAAFNRAEMVKWLLAHGADPELRDGAGLRAVDTAASLGAEATRMVLSETNRIS
jgi:ankyrin repeat protein